GGLDEIDRLEGPQQLAGDATRKAPRLRREGNVAHAVEYLVVGRLGLRGRPRLEHRVLGIGDAPGGAGAGPIAFDVGQEGIGRVVPDRAVRGTGRSILPILEVRLPAEVS